jgi:hypothetical protein
MTPKVPHGTTSVMFSQLGCVLVSRTMFSASTRPSRVPTTIEVSAMNEDSITIVRDRYGNRCAYEDESCSGGLEVHHVVPTRFDSTQFFELSNLELVCRVHHGMREREAIVAG